MIDTLTAFRSLPSEPPRTAHRLPRPTHRGPESGPKHPQRPQDCPQRPQDRPQRKNSKHSDRDLIKRTEAGANKAYVKLPNKTYRGVANKTYVRAIKTYGGGAN